MNAQFDEPTKSMAQSVTRRGALKKIGVGLARIRLARFGLIIITVLAFATQVFAQGGIPLWTNLYSGVASGDDRAKAIAVDSNGNVFVTGNSAATNGQPDYATVEYSGAGAPLWTNRYNGPGNGEDWVEAVATDSSGNVFVTGRSMGSGTGSDYATIKYSAGGTPLWTNRYNGPLNDADYALDLAVDGNGNVLVTGASYGSGSGPDYATIKYSGTGVPLWTNRYNGTGNGLDEAFAVAADASGNVVVTGASIGSNGFEDYATIKYSGAGVPLWTNRYNGSANDVNEASAVGVDGSGNVFVTGRSWNGSSYDYATVRYSSSGVLLWARRYDGAGAGAGDEADALAVDGDGDVVVTGTSFSPGANDYVTIKYSGAGVALWTNNIPGIANSNYRPAIAVDAHGNVFVTGWAFTDTFPFQPDYGTWAYSSEGVPLWTNRYNGPANSYDLATALAVDSLGNVYVTGSSIGDSYDYATIKYSAQTAVTSIPLDIQRLGNAVVLSWTNAAFGLQSAPGITGNFTNITGATSPFTNPISGLQKYFRLKAN